MPRRRTSATTSKRRSTSSWGSTAVGSSSTSTPPPSQPCSAAAIATTVRCTGVAAASGRWMSRSTSNAASTRRVSVSCCRHRTRPPKPRAKPPCSARLSWALELEDQAEVLVDEAQAVGHGPAHLEGDTVQLGVRARVGRVVGREQLDERRLARAVLAHERVHLARRDVELDVVQRPRPGEGLRQVADVQHRWETSLRSVQHDPSASKELRDLVRRGHHRHVTGLEVLTSPPTRAADRSWRSGG